MKRVTEHHLFVTEAELERALDLRASTVDVPCPCCGRHIRLTEAYINRYQSDEIKATLLEINQGVANILESELGMDPRVHLALRKIVGMIEAAQKPRLEVVR